MNEELRQQITEALARADGHRWIHITDARRAVLTEAYASKVDALLLHIQAAEERGRAQLAEALARETERAEFHAAQHDKWSRKAFELTKQLEGAEERGRREALREAVQKIRDRRSLPPLCLQEEALNDMLSGAADLIDPDKDTA